MIKATGIFPTLTFPYNRMASSVTDTEKLKHWINQFAANLAQLEGQPEYSEKSALFEFFKDRLKLYGFQLARQIVVVGQGNKKNRNFDHVEATQQRNQSFPPK